ncbi:MAG: ABC transporter ATP-binding protein/permease [Clostridia bacterium]|nr:ABC transporter ATP-binding protein/permease [Clostridia bacterium]
MELPFLINDKLCEEDREEILSLNSQDNPIIFVVLSDVGMNGKYQKNALVCRKDHLSIFDFETKTEGEKFFYSDAEKFYNKRMYGNGMIRAVLPDKKTKNIFRFSFSIVRLCDAVVGFFNDIIGGADLQDASDTIEFYFKKYLSVCPKCGRALGNYGAKCEHCDRNHGMLYNFYKYVKPETIPLVFSVFLSVITTAAVLTTPILTKELVDNIIPNKRTDLLIIIAVALLVIRIAEHGIGLIRANLLRKTGNKMLGRIRKDVYEKATHLPMRFYDKTSTGAVINRINGDTANLNGFMIRVSQEVVVQLFTLVGIIVVMMAMNWKLTLISLCPIPLIVIGSRIFRKKIAPCYRRIWLRNTAVSSVLTDNLPGIRVIKSFASEKRSAENFAEKVDDWQDADYKAGRIINLYSNTVGALISLGSILIWAIGGNAVISGNEGAPTIGLLVSFISYASMFYNPVNFFANFSDTTQNAKNSAERLMDIIDAEPEEDFGKGNKDADMSGTIEFKDVSFSFDRSKQVLKNINLKIESGDIVGIVGATGSGKSTLINLFLRYYTQYDGTILVDGKDIKTVDLDYYRSSIGYVQQEPQMFFDTIYNNIAYGKGNYTTEQVIAAADIANAHEFIIRQPNGYDSIIGERGVGLSGGERQRISIARAVLRDPKILVFDEATASVDSETEHLIQKAIENLISGRTTIMIAHRLSTLSKANKIVVVDKGRIIECGTPQELLEAKGKYYRLVNIQKLDKTSASADISEIMGEEE